MKLWYLLKALVHEKLQLPQSLTMCINWTGDKTMFNLFT